MSRRGGPALAHMEEAGWPASSCRGCRPQRGRAGSKPVLTSRTENRLPLPHPGRNPADLIGVHRLQQHRAVCAQQIAQLRLLGNGAG